MRLIAAVRPLARLVALLAALCLPAQSHAQSAPIFLDGRFIDWTGTLEFTDPAGDDGSSGFDFTL